MTIIIDCETTGLLSVSPTPLVRQPRIIQMYALKLNENFEEIGTYNTGLIDPKMPIEPDAVAVHHITDDAVKDQPTFDWHIPKLADFFLGERTMVAHNCAFDRDMLYYELSRNGNQTKFPWPMNHVCTVEKTQHLFGYRLKLVELHKHLFGGKFEGAHDAETDVRALAKCYVELVRRGDIKG